ncbi:NAD(P)/FAD-dependent oxidoreductase [soil metagenome]
MEHFDVLIVGAGLSGIGAGARLRMDCPEKTFAILEGRERSGGTWDLFRYPGVRSDSDMFTLGYRFRPWSEPKAIADGPSILNYIRETSKGYDLDKEIRYGHRVKHAEWSSVNSRWTVEVEITGFESPLQRASSDSEDRASSADGRLKAGLQTQEVTTQRKIVTCNFLYLCTGYYDYDSGYTPEWPGFENYNGTVIHPQKWPEGIEYVGKRVLVIGSGATAVTLVPAMAKTAEHVTMLQRSPTYIVTMPTQDKIANFFRSVLPAKAAYVLARWKNIFRQMFFYELARKYPSAMKRLIAKGVKNEVGEQTAEKHFAPDYNPWDQRLCVVPDSDLFGAIRDGRASVVTSQIRTFTETGVELSDGRRIDADIIVTATGLVLKIMSGLALVVDGKTVDLSKVIAYKGMMYSDVPNLAQAFGYTNASWTLKCDLTAEYVCRLLKYMDAGGHASCTPCLSDPTVRPEPVLDFTSGYVLRALDTLPSQGSKTPWKLHQNYVKDLSMLRYGRVDDGTVEFRRAGDSKKSVNA